MKKILSIILASLFCLSIFGCNKNTNYTTAAPYLEYELSVWGWTTTVNYKLDRAMGVLGKIEKGLEERGYECSDDLLYGCLKRDRLGRSTYRYKWIWVLFDREKPISDYGIVPIRFDLEAHDTISFKYQTVSRSSILFDQPYLEMMKDIDETIVHIRD